MPDIYEDMELDGDDPEVLVDLLASLLGLPDDRPVVEDDDIAAVILGRLERTDCGRRPEPTLADAAITLREHDPAPSLTEGPGVFRAFEVAVPGLEPFGYKAAARIEVIVDPDRGVADLSLTLYPAGDDAARLRATITAPDGPAHTVVIEDDGTAAVEGVAVPAGRSARLRITWHHR